MRLFDSIGRLRGYIVGIMGERRRRNVRWGGWGNLSVPVADFGMRGNPGRERLWI